MTEKPIWMPLYVGDYLKDTIGLSKSEHGSYLLAMMSYWVKREALEDYELQGILGNDFKRVSRYFVWCDDRWHHKRIDIELAKSAEKIQMAKSKSALAVQARINKGQIPQRRIKPASQMVSQGDLKRTAQEYADRAANGEF